MTFGFIFTVIIYSVINSFIGIYSFKILFDGNYKQSTIITFLVSISNILIIPLVLLAHTSIEISLLTASLVSFVITYKIIFRQELTSKRKGGFKELYTVGISAFIINNIVPFALIADKYFANHYFEIPVANAYTFAWSLTAPIFYIGNVIEKMIFSGKGNNAVKIFWNSFSLLFLLILLYNTVLIIGLNYLTFLFPKTIDIKLLRSIVYFMSSGYSFYVLFHFPVNGILFKYTKILTQEKIAAAYVILAAVCVVVMISLKEFLMIRQYKQLLFVVWIFIFSLLGIKILLMLYKQNELGKNT